jgi:hypothetical protein
LNSEYVVMCDGEVAFREDKAVIARRYTVLKFLFLCYREGMRKYLSKLLNSRPWTYVPHRPKIAARRCDPLKMVVLYDNDKREIDPMAVCLLLKNKQAAFALLDDFGRVLEDTTQRFVCISDEAK